MDPIYDLARNVVEKGYDDLPPKAIEVAKLQALDTLGVAIAGSSDIGVPELFQVVKGLGGKEEGSVIAYSTRLPAPHAAQVNATMAHALDYDDYQVASMTHPGCIVIPTAFAVAEALGNVSGKDCLAAIALAGDLLSRMGAATYYEGGLHRTGWHFTPLYGIFGAAAVAGKLMGLDEGKMVDALGLAYHQASGNLQCTMDGTLSKRIGPGLAARDGIMSALMAEAGITGAHNCLEGKRGLYNVYHNGGYKRDILLQDLGKTYIGADLVFKNYACVRGSHVSIEAALGLVIEHDIKPEEVQEITILGGKTGVHLSTPLEVKCRPRTTVDAQFSIPWVVATAIAKRQVAVADFTEQAIEDEDVIRVAQKIKAELDPELVSDAVEEGIRVKIATNRGIFSKRVDIATGDPRKPMTPEALIKKFRDCTTYSIKPMSKETVDNLVESIMHLEKLDDAAAVIRLMA